MDATDPRQLFHDLMLEVIAFRWSVEPDDEARRGPAIKAILEYDLSEVSLEHLRIEVAYNRSYWERHSKDPLQNHPGAPAWEGWDEEQDEWLRKLEPIQDRMDQAEIDAMGKRFDGFNHFISLDYGYRSCHSPVA